MLLDNFFIFFVEKGDKKIILETTTTTRSVSTPMFLEKICFSHIKTRSQINWFFILVFVLFVCCRFRCVTVLQFFKKVLFFKTKKFKTKPKPKKMKYLHTFSIMFVCLIAAIIMLVPNDQQYQVEAAKLKKKILIPLLLGVLLASKEKFKPLPLPIPVCFLSFHVAVH